MPSPENLTEFSEGFVIDESENPEVIQKTIYNGLARLYIGIDWMNVSIDRVSGTVFFASFSAEEERELISYNKLSLEEKEARDEVQRSLTRNISK